MQDFWEKGRGQVVGVNTVIKYGVVFTLFVFALLLYFAYQQQRATLNKMKDVKARLDRLSTLVEALAEEKKVVASHIEKKVERHSLAAIIDQTADALYAAVPKAETAVAKARVRR